MATFADITAVNVFAAYLQRYAVGASDLWFRDVSQSINSTGYMSIKSAALGDSKGLSSYTPGAARGTSPVAPYELTINPLLNEDSFTIPVQALRGDVTGIFTTKAGKMASAAQYAEQRALVTLMTTNPTCWTGEVLFLTTHQYASYATQSNKIAAGAVPSLAVVAAATPTPLEAMGIMRDVAFYAQQFRNEYNVIATADAKKFTILCPTAAIFAAFQTAVSVDLLQTTAGASVSNVVYAMIQSAGYQFKPVLQPEMVTGEFGATDVVFLRNDELNKGYVVGEEPYEPQYLGAGTEYVQQYQQAFFGLTKIMAFAPGRWESSIQATISTAG